MPAFPKLSLRERILLHLLEAEAAGHPSLAATQLGISNATGLNRGHVSRTLAALETEGLVASKRQRVDGFVRTLVVSKLSAAGQATATSLRDSLAGLTIEVRRPDGPPAEMPFHAALALSGAPASMAESAVRVAQAGFLLVDAPRSSQAPLPSPYVWDLEEAPASPSFVGRQAEMKLLRAWFSSAEPCCIVEGPGGIGKSALVANALRDLKPPRHLLWLPIAPGLGAELVLARLAAFLARLGRPIRTAGEGPAEALHNAAALLRGLPVVLILDDIHKASNALRPAFEALAWAAQARTGLKVVWVGRTIDLPVDALRRATRIDLAPLGIEECKSLLASLQVPSERQENLAYRSGGNPLLLELLVAGGGAAQETFAHHLTGDIRRLAPEEGRDLLWHLCTLRGPVSRAAFDRLGLGGQAALESLVKSRVVFETMDGALELHDEVRDALYARLPEDARKRIHSAWARAFDPRHGLDEVPEFLHHLTRAGRRPEAAWWALRHETQLLTWARAKFRHEPAASAP